MIYGGEQKRSVLGLTQHHMCHPFQGVLPMFIVIIGQLHGPACCMKPAWESGPLFWLSSAVQVKAFLKVQVWGCG